MYSIYTTRAGDVLDAICFKHYQNENMVETVLAANRGLCTQPVVFPIGIAIKLPVVTEGNKQQPQRSVRRIWG